jgi:hypothetical protein
MKRDGILRGTSAAHTIIGYRLTWERGMRQLQLIRLVIGVVSSALVWVSCGADSSGTSNVINSVKLTALTPKQLDSLCAVVLPKIRNASTPARQCTLQALTSTEVSDEASCKAAQQGCLDSLAYDDWSKATCARFTAADAGVLPHFDCTTQVSELTACFDKAAIYLADVNCKQAGKLPAPPPCLAELEDGACKFDVDLLLKDTAFKAPEPGMYACKDPSGGPDIPYDLDAGARCNACATAQCCASLVECLDDTDCECFLKCSGSPDACFSKCGITDYPAQFDAHLACIQDNCQSECSKLFE